MKFVNSVAKDYRQAKGSKGIDGDSGAAMPFDWMRGGKKRLDMGDGSYTLTQVGKYGVRVEHPNAVPRLSGTCPTSAASSTGTRRACC